MESKESQKFWSFSLCFLRFLLSFVKVHFLLIFHRLRGSWSNHGEGLKKRASGKSVHTRKCLFFEILFSGYLVFFRQIFSYILLPLLWETILMQLQSMKQRMGWKMKWKNLGNCKSLHTRAKSRFLVWTISLLCESTFKFTVMCNLLKHGCIM